MLIHENWPWQGYFTLALYNKITGQWKIVRTKNLITNAGLNWLRDRMYGASGDVLTDLAVGTGGTPPAPTDIALEAEVAPRKAAVYSAGGTGELTTDAFWDHTEINVHIREVGIFAGQILVARAKVDMDKTSQESLTITRLDLLGRG
jgi:hypothetical protein